jgi:hypothetical protein
MTSTHVTAGTPERSKPSVVVVCGNPKQTAAPLVRHLLPGLTAAARG